MVNLLRRRALMISRASAPASLAYITATFTPGTHAVYPMDALDSLKSMLVVTAHYSDSTSEIVSDYTLSGTLTSGTSIVTVSYGEKSTTFNVTVSTVIGHYGLNESGTTTHKGGVRTHTTYNLSIMNSSSRVVFGVTTGVRKYMSYENGSAYDIYPIPVPAAASEVIVCATAVPSYAYSLVIDLQTRTYDGTIYSAAVDSTGWIDANDARLSLTEGVQYLVVTVRGFDGTSEQQINPSNLESISVDFV